MSTGSGNAFAEQRFATPAEQPATAAPPERDPVEFMADHLEVLMTYYQEHLKQMPWVAEADRWAELAFSLIYATDRSVSASTAREATILLRHLGLLDVESLERRDATDGAMVLRVLDREGYSDAAASAALRALQGAAATLAQRFGGGTGALLEHYGGRLRDSLVDELSSTEVDREALGYAATVWLQNTTNLPLPSLDPAVQRLCERCDTAYGTFLQAAAQLGITVPVAEELVRIAESDPQFERWLSEQATGAQPHEGDR